MALSATPPRQIPRNNSRPWYSLTSLQYEKDMKRSVSLQMFKSLVAVEAANKHMMAMQGREISYRGSFRKVKDGGDRYGRASEAGDGSRSCLV